ncbi:hypothetical protein PE36_00285 [Moritella sp. PE36]|uniref:hypothetical protein n=1 Tax=Moritella sp. PE36 TaxID=58051 RepID=UPI00015693D5|nr:hypothetical protein [Moritella sp. PE36]EDM66188.1 hypothetical protein PE36_00285 [Moritella sp. PE36]
MANLRELIITANGTYEIIEVSPQGRERLSLGGEFSGATITLSQSLTIGGVTEPVSAIVDDLAVVSSAADYELSIGKKRNLILVVTGSTGATRIACVAVSL